MFPFFYAKISRNKEIFSKNSGKFSAAADDREKKIEISQPPPPPRKTSAYTSSYSHREETATLARLTSITIFYRSNNFNNLSCQSYNFDCIPYQVVTSIPYLVEAATSIKFLSKL
jgi:hypothetical protein